MYNITKQNPFTASLVMATSAMLVGVLMYVLLEPAVVGAQSNVNTFRVNQTIGAEIAFSTTQDSDITLLNNGVASIGGATGGTATGTATVAVTSNNLSGYKIDINFSDNTPMRHENTVNTIANYGTTTPDLNMNIEPNLSGFAYSASSSNAVTAFSNCYSGSPSADECYMMHGTPSGTYTIVDSNDVAVGEKTQVGFKVMVAPDSGLVNGAYQATTTLTATNNP